MVLLGRNTDVLQGNSKSDKKKKRFALLCEPNHRSSCLTVLNIILIMAFFLSGRSQGAILSQYYTRTMQMCRRRQSRPSIRTFSRSARPSICGYRVDSNALFDREGEENLLVFMSKKQTITHKAWERSAGY